MATEHEKVRKYFTASGCLSSLTRMKDDVYDKMVMDKLNSLNLRQKALSKTGLDEDQLKEIPPVYLHGFNYGDNVFMRIGKDGRLRSSKYDATWLFFSNTQMYMYSYSMDMTSDSKTEKTEEYFYKDITNFSTTTKSVSAPQTSGCGGNSKPQTRDTNEFTLVVPGDSFRCSISGISDADKVISAMKQKLREKKG